MIAIDVGEGAVCGVPIKPISLAPGAGPRLCGDGIQTVGRGHEPPPQRLREVGEVAVDDRETRRYVDLVRPLAAELYY